MVKLMKAIGATTIALMLLLSGLSITVKHTGAGTPTVMIKRSSTEAASLTPRPNEMFAPGATYLGQLDLWRYCRTIWGGDLRLTDPHDPDGWECRVSNQQTSIGGGLPRQVSGGRSWGHTTYKFDPTSVCQWQYHRHNAFAMLDYGPKPAYRWACYRT